MHYVYEVRDDGTGYPLDPTGEPLQSYTAAEIRIRHGNCRSIIF